VTLFYTERIINPSIKETFCEIPADGSMLNVSNANVQAEQIVEVRAFLEKRLQEATSTQQEYANKRTQPRMFAIGDMIWLSGKNIRTKQPSKNLDHRFYELLPVIEWVG
jgi:hypothetical protein